MLDVLGQFTDLNWWKKSSQTIEFWFGALIVGLAALTLAIIDKGFPENLFSLGLLMWLTLFSVLWDRKEDLTFRSNLFSTAFGGVLLALILLRNFSGDNDFSLRLLPLVGTFSVAVMASGIGNIPSYWRELLVSGLLIYAKVMSIVLQAINLPIITAKFGHAFLVMIGFQTYREGVFITLPKGRVEVLGACSGEESVILMVCVAFLFFFLVPISHMQKAISLVIAAIIGFLVNVVRITMLTIFVNANDREGFDYWHGEDGSLLFAIVSVCVFGLFCWLAYVRDSADQPSSELGQG